MSKRLAAEQIVNYNVASRAFELLKVLYSAVLLALWPTWTAMIAQHKWAQVRKHIWTYALGGSLVVAVCSGVLVVTMPSLVRLLAPNSDLSIATSFCRHAGSIRSHPDLDQYFCNGADEHESH